MNWKDEIDKTHKGQTGFFKQRQKQILKKIIMKTLNLKKDCRGSYSRKIQNMYSSIQVSLARPKEFGGKSEGWQLMITFDQPKKEYNEAIFEILLNEWFDTKKEAMKFGVKWIEKNM